MYYIFQNLPDEETKDLMVDFYKMLFDGKSKLNAIHEASLSVMSSTRESISLPILFTGVVLF